METVRANALKRLLFSIGARRNVWVHWWVHIGKYLLSVGYILAKNKKGESCIS